MGFHPVADGLIHVASGHELALWDLTKQKEVFGNNFFYYRILLSALSSYIYFLIYSVYVFYYRK